VLDPESGVTKERLALYLEAVAAAMLPHVADRPVSIVRCPEGSTKQCFFQKHAGAGLPRALGSVQVPDKKTGVPEAYITVDSREALVSLAQLGVLEIHPWGSRNESLERPDRLIFDLDPDEALPWPRLVASARAIRDLLKELKLESFVKTTGGKGLHLVVPIQPSVEWPQIKLFCRGIAAAIESTDPSLYLIKMTKAARKGRIFVDYLRNERGATAIAPYSPRARAGMRVAVPLDWDELDAGMPGYAVANFDSWRERLKHDAWAKMMRSKQGIRPEILAAVLETATR
jgi:bifunctional non-homologous end joining protein LigD